MAGDKQRDGFGGHMNDGRCISPMHTSRSVADPWPSRLWCRRRWRGAGSALATSSPHLKPASTRAVFPSPVIVVPGVDVDASPCKRIGPWRRGMQATGRSVRFTRSRDMDRQRQLVHNDNVAPVISPPRARIFGSGQQDAILTASTIRDDLKSRSWIGLHRESKLCICLGCRMPLGRMSRC